MASYVDWDDVEPRKRGSSGGSGGGKFLKLEANKEYTIRPLFRPIEFHKYFNKLDGQLRTAIVENPDTCEIRAKYTQLKKAQARRAFLAFHREDNNRLKVVELPSSATEAFKHYKKVAKTEPGGPQGGDFLLKVICPNGVKDRDTTYEIDFQDAKPFTEDERKFVVENVKSKDGKVNEEWDLEKIFAANTPEEIENRLFGDWQPPKRHNDDGENRSTAGAGSSSKGATQQQSKGESNAEDPFGF